MLDRKTCSEKTHKCSETMKKRVPCKFTRLFQFSEMSLPSELEKFVSNDRQLSDGDFSRNNTNKIRVILKINESKDTPSCLTINKNQNCVGLIDPTPSRRSQLSNSNINLFPFDSIFTESDQQSALLSSSAIDPIIDFFKGKDACIFSFGNSGLGKTKTMIGSDQSISEMGIIPTALGWIFKTIEQLKINRKTRYAVRISALEIANKNVVRDLLATTSTVESVSSGVDLINPGLFLLEKSNTTIVNNQKELAACNLLEAARILDTILSARSNDNDSLTHLQLIIHLYQYQLDTGNGVNKPVLGGRSRLHFLDLGSGRHSNDDSSILSLQGMSKVILALYTSQRHIPYKDNVLTQLLKETIGVNTITTMLVHISSKEQNYNDTLQIVQLASKLYRTRSRKSRSVGFLITDETSSCSSSSSGFHSRRLRPHMGIGAARRSSGNSSASSELDLTSASELSCCETVIFRGNANNSGSEKSSDRRSVQHNPMSGSSESDLMVSDKESSKEYGPCSTNTLSPSAIRRRRMSPRTNARAWPSSITGSNTTPDNEPELWVDGPNAVYKSDRKQQEHKEIIKEPSIEATSSSAIKPVMMSKETQCDDIWDSSSSLTDGSSHSNTLDRKDHRPLSDISECTEDTESNLATETELVKMNIMNDICPINDLDDILESTFGLSPLHQDLQPKMSDKELKFSRNSHKVSPPCHSIQDKENICKTVNEAIGISQFPGQINLSTNAELEMTIPAVKNTGEVRKHYHSASDSKRSTKSEQKERKSKSKCKKCSKKPIVQPSTSLTSSNSTDFSRVASWIQNVEYEIQTAVNGNNEDEVFLDNTKSYEYSLHNHHQSQPDISCHKDRFSVSRSQIPQYPVQHQYPPADNNWRTNDCNHGRYSLYGGYQMPPPITTDVARIHLPSVSSLVPCVPHALSRSTSAAIPPYHSPIMTREHVHSYGRHSVSTTNPPLPPLPQQMLARDNRVSLSNNLQHPVSYDGQLLNASPLLLTGQPKCKTLPRDMYSDPASPLKRNKSELHSSNATQFKGQSITTMQEIKSREKVKKESKNIMSILFAPFISLKNKINKGKCSLEKQTNNGSENDTDKSLQRESDFNIQLDCSQKTDPEFVLSSPYHLMTPPKTSTVPTESSSHGSDSSSLQNRPSVTGRSYETSKQHKCRNKSSSHNSKNTSRQRPTSSGYGSIIIKGDSEVSSHNDSSSEYSISGPKVLSSHSRMKQSVSLSNCKSVVDNSAILKGLGPETHIDNTIINVNGGARIKNTMTAQDLILLEKLRISLNEERKVVIEYIETNRMRGVPVDACVMNLICFKGIDNFEISNSKKRDECRSIIEQIDQEIEQLKQKLTQAQNHLLLITTFDSRFQSANS